MRLPAFLVWVGAVGYALVAAYFSLARHHAVLSGYDLANFDQELWLLAHGREPLNTMDGRLFWGEHFSLTIGLLTPLYVLGGNAAALLSVQAITMASVAPLLYALARTRGARPWLALLPSLLWLASPLTLIVNLDDFHHVPLVAPLIAGSILALARDRLLLFSGLGLLACLAKEDVSLIYVMVGIVVALEGHRWLGVEISLAALAIFVFATEVFMPAFGDSASWFERRFAGDRGASIGDVAGWMLEHPRTAAGDLVTTQNITVVVVLLLTTGGLCLLAPRWMLLGMPALAHNLLSAYEPQHEVGTHYVVPVTLSFFLASSIGIHRLPRLDPVPKLLFGAAVATALMIFPFGIRAAQTASSWSDAETALTGGLSARRGALALIPKHAVVSASNGLAAQLSERAAIYAVPLPFLGRREFGADWSADEMALRASAVRWIAIDTSDRPNEFPDAPERLLSLMPKLGFRQVYSEGTVRVFVRDRPTAS